MHVGIVGSGPAVESLRAAFSDVDATVDETTADRLGRFDFGAVVGATGAGAFRTASDAATRWIAVEIGGVGGFAFEGVDAAVSAFGPGSGCYRCLAARVEAGLDADPAAEKRGVRSAVRYAGALAGRRAVSLLSGEDVAGTVVEVPGPERTFLPVPGCSCGDAPDRTPPLTHREVTLADALDRAERAVDDRVGPVDDVGERESFPVPYYLARTADTTGFSDVRAAELAAGVDLDWNAAFMKALGEALERYAAGVYRTAAFRAAPARGVENPVPPGRFVRPDDAATPAPDEPIRWVEGVDLLTEETVALPASVVQFPPPEERYAPAITTGLGLGNSGVEAVLSGLYESVERDATMLAWYSSFEPLGLSVTTDATRERSPEAVANYEALEKRARAEGLTATSLLVTQDVDVPVVATAVHREGEWPRFALGSAADLDVAAAATAALAEALQNWSELRAMGPERAAEEESAIGTYADFPGAARRFVSPDGAVPAASVGPDALPSGEAELSAALDRVADAGLEAYAARLTTRDLERLGFEAVRVLVPAAQPLFVGEPFFGERARRVPRSLGFEPRLDRAHHPFP